MTDASALASSIALYLGSMDLDELTEVDAFVMSILRERHEWARCGQDVWHHVVEYGKSVVTACNGRWSSRDTYDIKARPLLAERCEACQGHYVAARRAFLTPIERGLSELANATETRTQEGE